MSVSQNLLASFNIGSLPAKSLETSVKTAEVSQAEGLASFAEVLLDQQSDDVKALMQLLGEGQDDAADPLLGAAELAADGKTLPDGMQAWLAQLDDLRSETADQAALLQAGATSADQQEELSGLAAEWSQWLAQARQFIASEQVSAQDGGVDPGALPAAAAAILRAVNDPAAIDGEPLDASDGKRQRDVTGLKLLQDQAAKGERDARQEPAGNAGLRATAERGGQVDGQQPVQRNLDMTPGAAEGKAAFAGKLADTLEALGGRQASVDTDSGDAQLRPGAQTQAATQGALAARPVLAASQTLNVPFGQTGWGDAVTDKMMWMSSQNLRSVEIRLDPADMGPLEIHIQTRGQEHQVQFVTQNPSVREALEAHMFRLREAFSQQGMDLVNVSVGDSAVDQQARHQQEGSADGRGRGSAATQTVEANEVGMMLASAAASQAESSRLIDYYA